MGKGKDKAARKHTQGRDPRQEKANERQERARLRKDRQRNGYYCSDADDREFEAQVGQIGCRIQFMEGDGNCLFRSLADQLEGRPQDHAAFRAQIVLHLERNREAFEPYMEDDEPFGDYLERMRGDAEWGGNQELVAASQLYKANIVVHQFKAPRFFIPFEKARRTIHLSYHGDYHYNSVRALNDEGDGPALAITLQATALGSQGARDSSKAKGASSPWPQDEEFVSRSCPWASPSSVVDALKATGGRADDAIELLVSARNEASQLEHTMDAKDSGGKGGGRENGSHPPENSEASTPRSRETLNKGRKGGGVRVGKSVSGNSAAANGNPPVGEKAKITRKADCPCGSGLKYRKCCSKKDAAIARGQIPAASSAAGDGTKRSPRDSSLIDDLGSLVI